MEYKETEIKTKRTKTAVEKGHTAKVASICNCSESMVRMVLAGKRGNRTAKGESIIIASTLITEGENKLLNEVKKLIQF